MQKNLRRSEYFELNTILRVVLGINPNVIDESPSKLPENYIFCVKYSSVLQFIFYLKGQIFFFNCTLPLSQFYSSYAKTKKKKNTFLQIIVFIEK